MRSLQRFAAAVSVGLHRVRHGGRETALVAVGVAAAAALLAAVLLGTSTAERRTLEQAVERLPPPSRTVRVAWFGVPSGSERYASVDTPARRSLARVVDGRPAATVLFRESTIGGAYVSLGAVDGLERWVRLTAGRVPRTCTPTRCEVLQLRGSGGLPQGFAVVGRGRLRTTALFGEAVPAERNELERARLAPGLQRVERYHQPALPPLLLASGVRALAALPELESSYRSYAWVAALPSELRPWDVAGIADESARARASLQARSVGFDVAAPIEELVAARDRARVGARRLLLLGGQGAALLLGFAAFAATRLRARARASDRRLALAGVPLWQRGVALVVHASALAVGGVLAAWAAALALAAAFAGSDVAARALVAPEGVGAAVILTLAATASIVVALGVRSVSSRALDVIAGTLAVAVAAALARGNADADELLRQGGSGVVLLVLPAAVVAIAAVLVARLLGPVVRRAERRVPPRAVATRLAAVSLARRAGGGAVAAAFLVVSIALALFAAVYRSTLEQGQRDQAAFALGADFVVREDLRRLVPVRTVATPERLRNLRADAAPVVRASANVPGLADATGVAVLGLDRTLFEDARGADVPHPPLALESTLTGPRLPADVRRLTFDATSSRPGVTVEAAIRRRDGSYTRLRLGGAVPRDARGGTLVGLRIVPPPRLQERGADAGQAFVGELALGRLEADGAALAVDFAEWIGVGGASYSAGRLRYTLSNQVDTWFRPRQALDGRAVPAVVSPTLASLADERGRLPLQVDGQPVTFDVRASAPRFPSTRGEFVVADRRTLQAVLDLADPGSGVATEVWVNARTRADEARLAAALRRAPFDALELDSRRSRESELRADPLARGSLTMLAVAAGAAFVLALVAVTLAAVSDLRDERDELFDLETQGAAPALLRRLVRLRQLVVAAVGIAGGLAAGALLAALVVDVVSISAGGAAPVPPLRLDVEPAPVLVALALLAVVAAAAVAALTHSAFATGEAGRPREAE